MNKPFFSIIIPALNEEKYLPHLLSDLASQTYSDFEVIVVDGHSKDKTVEKAKSFASKLPSLKVLSSPKRHVCVQRNLGAKTAGAKTLIFMDADNRLPSYFLQGIKYRLESDPADLATTWFKPDQENATYETIAQGMNLTIELQNNLKPSFMLESMIIVNKPTFLKIGGFDTSINYAEGRQFVQGATKLGAVFKTYRDPQYAYSFRRFRKYGTINLLKKTSHLALASLLGDDYRNKHSLSIYPMLGGSYYEEKLKTKKIDIGAYFKKVIRLITDQS